MSASIGSICRSCLLLVLLIAVATAAGAASEDFAKQVLAETNLARTQPRRYAGYLQEMRRLFQGKGYRVPGSPDMVLTSEGVAAVDEAIAFLSQQAPLPALIWSQGLAEAAADLARDQGRTSEVGHAGSRGGMRERIERHGTWTGRIAENIGYGPSTARLMVIELIVDDGVPGRGHRKNIFTRDFSVAGAACGPHPRYGNMCAMDFAGGFKSRDKR